MTKPDQNRSSGAKAFTLIELLVVIAIIAVLAAMLFPAFGIIKAKSAISKAKAERDQVVTAIESYKATHGFYPPDNPADLARSQLFYELLGTKQNGVNYETLDGREQIPVASVPAAFDPIGLKVGGFVNCTKSGGGDETGVGKNFLSSLKPGQYGFATNGGVRYGLLTTSVAWPASLGPVAAGLPAELNPWRYNHTAPTHNLNSFDLWVDIVVSGKTNRISNWSKDPEIVSY